MASASLPASSAALANGAMLTTFGLILVMSGSLVALRHAATTCASNFKSVPNYAPPSLMFGQETFNSSAPTPPSAANRRATSAYSSTVVPQMLMMVGTFNSLRNGQYFLMNPSTPGPCKPMALSIPLATSAVRGVGLPRTGFNRMPLTVTAPSWFKSINREYSAP